MNGIVAFGIVFLIAYLAIHFSVSALLKKWRS